MMGDCDYDVPNAALFVCRLSLDAQSEEKRRFILLALCIVKSIYIPLLYYTTTFLAVVLSVSLVKIKADDYQ